MNPELDKYDVEKQAAPEITVVLSIQELNTVLAALAEMPHRVSDPIIRKVFTQANEQIPQQRVN